MEGKRGESIVCGYFLYGDYCREITTAVGKYKHEF
jgi:hypothetical protein